MKYISTRGQAPVLAFADVLLAGLARDGGLYLPESWPRFSKTEIRRMRGLPYHELALRLLTPFTEGSISADELAPILRDSYASANFPHPAVAPLTQIGPDLWMMELFHGPTLAFKDYALQLVGRLFDHVLARRGQRVCIVGATSGDTGSAAIEACRDRAAVDVFILHPKGRVSEVQRRQMTTVASANVHNIAIEGTFDDCQDMVKAMFNDAAFRDRMSLSAVNSINWARIMAQIVYYFHAALAVGAPDRKVAFSVPTGNFGNVYAGFAAREMGLPISRLVIGSNRNDILTRFLDTGAMRAAGVHPTLSPSMDIQVSSNFERLLFDSLGRDGARTRGLMEIFRQSGNMSPPRDCFRQIAKLFSGRRYDDEETKAVIRETYARTGLVLDPHSAIGVAAAHAAHNPAKDGAMVALATAHPAKFPDAVESATGYRPGLPPRLADLMHRPERLTVLPNDLRAVQAFVSERARAGIAA